LTGNDAGSQGKTLAQASRNSRGLQRKASGKICCRRLRRPLLSSFWLRPCLAAVVNNQNASSMTQDYKHGDSSSVVVKQPSPFLAHDGHAPNRNLSSKFLDHNAKGERIGADDAIGDTADDATSSSLESGKSIGADEDVGPGQPENPIHADDDATSSTVIPIVDTESQDSTGETGSQ